ncbi:MAG: hypothetical protein QNJ74_18150 [Trichodesmium sp. MO_231.B1]|nr:hypothetical protein [Trichodesmium sp. MO_231.B1]
MKIGEILLRRQVISQSQLKEAINIQTSMKMGEILLRRQVISQSQLKEAIDIQTSMHLKLGELLMFQGWIKPENLEEALKEQYWRQNGYWIID